MRFQLTAQPTAGRCFRLRTTERNDRTRVPEGHALCLISIRAHRGDRYLPRDTRAPGFPE
jgi:hypothetical protein